MAAASSLVGLQQGILKSKTFSDVIEVSRKNLTGRIELLTFFLSKTKHDETIDVGILARTTWGLTARHIKQLISRSVIKASMQNRNRVSMHDICYVFLAGKFLKTSPPPSSPPPKPPRSANNKSFSYSYPSCNKAIESFFCRKNGTRDFRNESNASA